MATNQYFGHYSSQNEQNLIEDLIIESIQAQGIDMSYIPRDQVDIDSLYLEDPSNSFNDSYIIEMYPASVDGFDGQGEFMDTFGLNIKKTATFIVSKKRFSEEIDSLSRPIEGDLIFMPITNAVLEIKYVNHESPFFEKGKQYVYEIQLETFEYGYEDITTNDINIDGVMENMEILNPDVEQEEYAKNDEIDLEYSDEIVWTPENPFGVR